MSFPTLYQDFIYKSRYARWLPEKNRRETWEETVKRYFDFFVEHLQETNNYTLTKEELIELEAAIINLEVMPSMRCLMTAGKALKKDNIAGYNCSYIAIDRVRSFDEMLYILMNGVGVGFSVERQYINKLPNIAEEFFDTDTTIVVADSKLGWAKAFKELISLLYQGLIPKWDLGRVRPAGAPLKTFGGRASGPEPLNDLFKFTTNIFKEAAGRKLTSVECHDLCCKIAEVVVVGGSRRSALISFSNLSDDRMRNAKSGNWWETFPHRALANNSAVYNERPDIEIFIQEWLSLIKSKSGERGIFNSIAAKKQASKSERRDPSYEYRSNPCITADTWVLTSKGNKQVKDLISNQFFALVNNKNYNSNGFYSTGVKPIYKVILESGYELKITDNHKLLTKNNNWVEVKDLKPDMEVVLNNTQPYWDNNNGTYEEGYIIGHIIGDGTFTKNSKEVYIPTLSIWLDKSKYNNKNDYDPYILLQDYCMNKLNHRSDFKGFNIERETDKYIKLVLKTTGLNIITNKFNLKPIEKVVPEFGSKQFNKGLLQAFFDTDGSIQGTQAKGVSIRLGQTNLGRLKAVQRLLLSFGIYSKIYENRKPEGFYNMPDNKGGYKDYYCQTVHELVISRDSIIKFNDEIGFLDNNKYERLQTLISAYKRKPYKDNFYSRVKSIKYIGEEEVFDCEVDTIHAFSANGIIAHNCNEVLLKSRQTCNLTEAVIRPNDTYENLKRKVKIAAILGTIQSTLVNFRYILKEWKDNCEEERLLGVSLTGIFDHPILNATSKEYDKHGFNNFSSLEDILISLKNEVINTNKEWSKKLGINQSTATTLVKPSGTVSQLVDSASGIHARHSQYYIRRVRADKKDPLAKLMIDSGFPVESDYLNPDSIYVFSFPIESPKNAITRNDISAIEHLKIWKLYQDYWCEHKPSVTITIKEDEWLEVADWVYKNFDNISGLSFLPHSNHTYRQAPYEDCTKEQYEDLIVKMPKDIDWKKLSKYEKTDNTTSTQELACVSGVCEIT